MPQLCHDAENGRPFLDSAIRSRVASWLPLSRSEASLPLRELARRHPPRMGRIMEDEHRPQRRRIA